MDRTYRLQFCKQCKNRLFSSQKGIICSLTGQQADFEEDCENFIPDETVQAKPQKTIANIARKSLMNYYTGYLATMYFGLILIIGGTILLNTSSNPGLLIIGATISMLSSIFSMVILYHLWDFIINEYRVQGQEPPIDSPGKAVGYLFIPLYNFYWLFIAIGKLPRSINELARNRNTRSLLPENLGILISIFTLAAIIPLINVILTFVSGMILMPILFYKAIYAIKILPSHDGNPISFERNEVDLGSITDFSYLFRINKFGFNYKLGILYLFGYIFLNITISFILNGITNFHFNFDLYFAYETIFGTIYIFILILLANYVNKFVLPVFSGFIYLLKMMGTYMLFTLTFKNIQQIQFSSFLTLPTLSTHFAYGFFLIFSLVMAIKLWGTKLWSIAIAAASTIIIANIVWYGLSYLVDDNNLTFSARSIIFIPLAQIIIFSTVFYFGFYWHVNLVNGESKPSGPTIDALDYGL
jgi:hypothetical protein